MRCMNKPYNRSTAWAGVQPTPQQTLLLQMALYQGEAALAAWREWRLTADLDQLPPGGFGLLPLLAYNLQKLGVSDRLLDKCQGIHRRAWTQNQLYFRHLVDLFDHLQGAGLTPVLHGDVVLALAYYPTHGARLIHQVTVITPESQSAAIQTHLAQTQWRPVQTPKARLRALISGGVRPHHFYQPGSDLTLYGPAVGLHPAPPLAADLWQHTQPLPINGLTVQRIGATDLLFALCSQGSAEFWRFGLIQWLADAHLLLQSAAPLIDWARLCKQAQQQACTVRLAAALHGLQEWLDVALPADVLPALAQQKIQPFEQWEAEWLPRLPPTLSKGCALWLENQRRRWAQQHERMR